MNQALVQESIAILRREKARPLTPTLMINGFQTPYEAIQAGIFGLGQNSSLNQWFGRSDLSYQPLWQLEAFGIGNLARIKEARGMQSEAVIEFFKAQDGIAGDVTRAHAAGPVGRGAGGPGRTVAARVDHRVQRQPRGPPADIPVRRRPRPHHPAAGGRVCAPAHEALARRVLLDRRGVQPGPVPHVPRARLPGREVAVLRPPGDVTPVDTVRPGYLPPVGYGPPPATR